jgi:hypothetical protein
MPTGSALEAARILRDAGQFQWYVITLFALIVYVYAVEIERKNWDLVFAGLAYWGMDWFNEIWCLSSLIAVFPYCATLRVTRQNGTKRIPRNSAYPSTSSSPVA